MYNLEDSFKEGKFQEFGKKVLMVEKRSIIFVTHRSLCQARRKLDEVHVELLFIAKQPQH